MKKVIFLFFLGILVALAPLSADQSPYSIRLEAKFQENQKSSMELKIYISFELAEKLVQFKRKDPDLLNLQEKESFEEKIKPIILKYNLLNNKKLFNITNIDYLSPESLGPNVIYTPNTYIQITAHVPKEEKAYSQQWSWNLFPDHHLTIKDKENNPKKRDLIEVIAEIHPPQEAPYIHVFTPQQSKWLKKSNVVLPKPKKGEWVGAVVFIIALASALFFFSLMLPLPKKWIVIAFCIFVFGGSAYLFIYLKITESRVIVPDDENTKMIYQKVFSDIYRAFDYREEGPMYDQLQRAVHSDFIEDLYKEFHSRLKKDQAGQGQLQVWDIEMGAINPGEGKAKVCQWIVKGFIRHKGHLHRRHLYFFGEFLITHEDQQWKLKKGQILEQKVLLDESSNFKNSK